MGLRRQAAGRLMEVVVTSVENVKPAAAGGGVEFMMKKPVKLCLLDQLWSSFYTSFVFFYPAKQHDGGRRHKGGAAAELKASLSKALNPFYPLAGRVRDNIVIDDFQAGVPFLEARVRGRTLSEFLGPPDLDLLNDLFPFDQSFCLANPNQADDIDHGGIGLPQIAVQMNTFDCGGKAIGLNFHHKVIDGSTAMAFLNTWSAITNASDSNYTRSATARAQRSPTVVLPDWSRASSVFPPQPSIPPWNQSFSDRLLFQDHRRTATRRFVFDEKAVAALRRRARDSQVDSPSRSETLSAFVWESALRADSQQQQRGSDNRLRSFGQAVNIRSRMGERLSANSMGNLLSNPLAFYNSQGGGRETMEELVGLIRHATCGVNEAFLNAISGEEGFAGVAAGQKWLAGQISSPQQMLLCSSWLSFDLHGFELGGLGKPAWVGVFGEARGNQPCIENFMILKELAGPVGGTKLCGAVEAWIRLDADVMAALERDPKFLEFASHNPPLIFD